MWQKTPLQSDDWHTKLKPGCLESVSKLNAGLWVLGYAHLSREGHDWLPRQMSCSSSRIPHFLWLCKVLLP